MGKVRIRRHIASTGRRRRRAGGGATGITTGITALALLASLPTLAVTAPVVQAAPQSAENSTATHLGATAQAVETGEPVEVTGERTAYSTTLANPDGSYTLTQSAVPQRVKGDDGNWHAVDATLEKRTDGTVGPKSTVVDLSFSGGGDGSGLIKLGNEQGSIALGWPDTLPEPRLDGAKAVYPEVFNGVDLELTATAEGYREVLVVKSAEAAANPALEHIKLTATATDLDIVGGAGGGLRALDQDGNTVFKGPAGQMWDSASQSEGPSTQLLSSAATEPAPDAPVEEGSQPRAGDASAVMPVQIDDQTVSVSPDLDLLRGEKTVYPVFIDPSVGLGVSERTVLSSDGDKFWQFDGDYGVGRCSVSGPYYCGSNYTNRMYFEFSPSKLAGKYILDATFRAYETWSFSCEPKWVDLERTKTSPRAQGGQGRPS